MACYIYGHEWMELRIPLGLCRKLYTQKRTSAILGLNSIHEESTPSCTFVSLVIDNCTNLSLH